MNRLLSRRCWRRRTAPLALILALLAAGWPQAGRAVTQLQRGAEAPPLALKDQSAAAVSNATLRGHIALLIFGELYHEKTREACAQVGALLEDPRLAGLPIVPVLIVTQEHGPDGKASSAPPHLSATVALDPERSAFGAYQVMVMPSLVVLDKEGRVVHAVAGLIPRLTDLITDSLLFAGGKLSAEALEHSIEPPTAAAPSDQGAVRANRLALLGRQLLRRGLDEMAAAKLHEALELDSKNLVAHQELGRLLLKQSHLAEAEAEFRAVLADQPESTDAALGLAFVQTQRAGTEELGEAEKTVRGVLSRSPSLARAHYLLGLIRERAQKPDEAAASYRKAAELLLDRAEQE